MREKTVSVYKRKGCFLLHPNSRTTHGVWISQQPGLGLDEDTPDKILGTCVLMLAEESTIELPDVAWEGKRFELFRLAGVQGWRGFVSENPKYVFVTIRENSALVLDVWKRDGQSYISDVSMGKSIFPLSISATELGYAIRRLLQEGT